MPTSTTTSPGTPRPSRLPWWCEPRRGGVAPPLLLIALVVAGYFLRLADLPLRGEEPTRAQVGFEMFQRHDWLVPREQGDPFLSRPPLQNWAVVASTLALGGRGAWAVRFPSALATLLTVLLIYGYARNFLSPLGAFAAAAAFATFGEMFQIGPEAETEPVFILLITASLLVWHWGWVRRWPDALTWSAGYGFMALAVLAKGPQPPVYFLGAVAAYVLLTRDWRRLFSTGHLIGLSVGAALLAAWFVPVYFQEGATTLRGIVLSDTASRFRAWTAGEVATHLLVFPLEILGGTLPWSPLLLAFVSRDFRRSVGAARPLALFTGAAVVLAFPTCWIPPGGVSRYFAPLYPCMAVLIGVVVEGCGETAPAPFVRGLWRRLLLAASGLMVGAGAAAVVAALCLPGRPGLAAWAEPPLIAAAYAVVCVVLAVVACRALPAAPVSRVRAGVLALAAFMTATCAGVLTDVRGRRAERPEADVARLKERLPPGGRLVSFDHVATLFAYLYGDPIPARPWPTAADPAAGDAYFCFTWEGASRPSLPFAWEEVAAICMDRNHHAAPEVVVVVGRRLPAGSRGAAAAGREPGALLHRAGSE